MAKAAAVVGLLSGGVLVLLLVTMVGALLTGLYVDHGQNVPAGIAVPMLVAIGGLAVAGAMWAVDCLARRWGS